MKIKSSRKRIRGAAIAGLACALVIMLTLCECSRSVHLTELTGGKPGVSAYGTCIACHSSEDMITLSAKPVIPPESTGS